MPITCSAVNISRKSLLRELVLDGLIGISPRFLRSTTQSVFSVPLLQWLRSLGHWLTQYVNFSRKLELFHHTNLIFFCPQNHTKNTIHGLLGPRKQQRAGCLWEPHVQHQRQGRGGEGCSIRSESEYRLHHGLRVDYLLPNLMTWTSNGTTIDVRLCRGESRVLPRRPEQRQQHGVYIESKIPSVPVQKPKLPEQRMRSPL